MISLAKYRKFWETIVSTVPEIQSILPVTIDDHMGKKIQALPADRLTLFMFPPLAESDSRNADAFREVNRCVVFVMSKYDPQRRSSFDLLEEIQPVVETVKSRMLAMSGAACLPFKVDAGSIETAPETELYGRFAGWSLTFTAHSL